MAKTHFAAPKGTRDLYPNDLLRRRYVTQTWRDTAIRHGFTEIDGPTFEISDLYAVKSGDGILGELFQAYSGKSAEEVAAVRDSGRAPFALRPEFTPTLARMYAARAKQLPQPTRWFSIGPFFRAERPQRGRLREFLQWNLDVVGGSFDQPAPDNHAILETLFCACESFGLPTQAATLKLSDRNNIATSLIQAGLGSGPLLPAFQLLDRRLKMKPAEFEQSMSELGINVAKFDEIASSPEVAPDVDKKLQTCGYGFEYDPSIVRGLAYYTGMVFELIADGERAIAGGGRYDNLVQLLGADPTGAVGMAMGDVVLMNLLDDLGLMPEGRELLEAVGRPPASLRPDLFIVTPHEELDQSARRLAAALRRGPTGQEGTPTWRRTPGLHVRVTDKSTRKVNKLIEDAKSNCARRLLILESDREATLTDLDNKDAERITLPTEADAIRAAVSG